MRTGTSATGGDFPVLNLPVHVPRGDGDWALERLAFGFMVENQYHAVYRLWTRAWLITK